MRGIRRRPKENEKDVNYRETYFRFLGFARPYMKLVAIVLFLALIGSFVGVLPDQILGLAVDRIFDYAGNPEAEEPAPDSGVEEAVEAPPAPQQQFGSVLPVTPYVDRITDFVTGRWLVKYTPVFADALTLALIFMMLYIVSRGINMIQGLLTVYIGQTLIYDVRKKVYNHLQKLSFKYFADNRTGDVMARVVNDVDSLSDVQ